MNFLGFRVRAGLELILLLFLFAGSDRFQAEEAAVDTDKDQGIPIAFTLKDPGFVTLVIEDSQGKRVRNLISETPFPSGNHVVYWDGLDDLDRDKEAAAHAVYHVPGKVVPAGEYTVRGLARPKIGLTYELAPYTNGKPAWLTEDRSSGWLADHTPPSAMLFLPAGVAPLRENKPASAGGQILVGSFITEGGQGLAWLDLDGNKLHDQKWVGNAWTAATQLARDTGENPVPNVYAYTGAPWLEGGGDDKKPKTAELRLSVLLVESAWGKPPAQLRFFGTGEDGPVLPQNYVVKDIPPDMLKLRADDAEFLGGLAVHNGLLVASITPANELVFIDARQRIERGIAQVKDPRGLAFDRDGRLLVLSGSQLLRYTLGDVSAVLANPEIIVKEGLEDPQQLTIDQEGNFYISDWGNSHQVKVFQPNGHLLRKIGSPGKPTVGFYDPTHMNHPYGITVDDRGRLWVAEKDYSPKRLSVWSKEGVFENAFYGPSRYGGGGSLDSEDKTRFFYVDERGGMELKLDWKTGGSIPEDIYSRTELDPVPLSGKMVGDPPSTPIHYAKRLYLTNAYNTNPTNGASCAEISMLENGIARKVAAMGNIVSPEKTLLPVFQDKAFVPFLPAGFDPAKDDLFFAWSDLNGDGKMQPNEVVFLRPERETVPGKTRIGGVTVLNDLSFIVAEFGDEALHFVPKKFTAAGVPVYDAVKGDVLVQGILPPPSTGGGQALVGKNGWSIFTTAPQPFSDYGIAGFRDGKPFWSYPNMWPGLHASHNAPLPEFPGELVGVTRLLGPPIILQNSDAGEIWAVNGNKGTIYLFTMDGLFVATLFKDSRTASWTAPQAVPGMPVDQLSLREECFWPMITQMRDGEVYLQVGTNDGPIRLIHVSGLEGIRRLPDEKIDVSAEMLRSAVNSALAREAQRQSQQVPNVLSVPYLAEAPVFDGKSDKWAKASWALIDTRTLQTGDWGHRQAETRAALAVSGEKLYAAFETYDPNLLENTGESLPTLFKSGGCLDLMIGATGADPQRMQAVAGDMRLLVTRANGKTLAVLYHPVDPSAKSEPVIFTSTVRTVRMDSIEDVSADVQLDLETVKNDQGKTMTATYEFSIPLVRLGLKPGGVQSIKGDLGVLRGDGMRTLERSYWSNKSAGLVSDTPSEAELIPRLWGTFDFEPTK